MGQMRVQSSLPEPSWALLSQWGALILVLVLVRWLQGLQLSSGGVDLSGAQVSPLVIGLSAALGRPYDITITSDVISFHGDTFTPPSDWLGFKGTVCVFKNVRQHLSDSLAGSDVCVWSPLSSCAGALWEEKNL